MQPRPRQTKPNELTREEINNFEDYVEDYGPIGDTPYRDVAVKIVNDVFRGHGHDESKINELIDHYESRVPIFIEYKEAFHTKFNRNFDVAATSGMLYTSENKPLVDSFKAKFGDRGSNNATILVASLLCCDLIPSDEAFKKFIQFSTTQINELPSLIIFTSLL